MKTAGGPGTANHMAELKYLARLRRTPIKYKGDFDKKAHAIRVLRMQEIVRLAGTSSHFVVTITNRHTITSDCEENRQDVLFLSALDDVQNKVHAMVVVLTKNYKNYCFETKEYEGIAPHSFDIFATLRKIEGVAATGSSVNTSSAENAADTRKVPNDAPNDAPPPDVPPPEYQEPARKICRIC